MSEIKQRLYINHNQLCGFYDKYFLEEDCFWRRGPGYPVFLPSPATDSYSNMFPSQKRLYNDLISLGVDVDEEVSIHGDMMYFVEKDRYYQFTEEQIEAAVGPILTSQLLPLTRLPSYYTQLITRFGDDGAIKEIIQTIENYYNINITNYESVHSNGVYVFVIEGRQEKNE